MARFLLVVAMVVAAGAARAQVGALPPVVAAFTQENIAACRGAGGSPSLQGLSFPGAGEMAEVYSPYVTEAELNGDGQPDFVTDLAGLECTNAWSYFCGSAGCPVTVWLSGPSGHWVGWGGSAQAWRLDAGAVVVALHGQLCTPPRIGADSCEVELRFDGLTVDPEAGAGGADAGSGAEAPVSGAPAVSLRPRPRPAATAPTEKPIAPETTAAAPPVRAPAPEAAAGWSAGQMPDGSGWFAGVTDAAAGLRLDWLCAKGRRSFLALSPYAGAPRLAFDVGGRVQEAEVEVVNGAAYLAVDLTSAIFLHLLSGPAVAVSEPGGAALGAFTMEGAPAAIGQAEGRCRV